MFMHSSPNYQFGTLEKICQQLQFTKCRGLVLNPGAKVLLERYESNCFVSHLPPPFVAAVFPSPGKQCGATRG